MVLGSELVDDVEVVFVLGYFILLCLVLWLLVCFDVIVVIDCSWWIDVVGVVWVVWDWWNWLRLILIWCGLVVGRM